MLTESEKIAHRLVSLGRVHATEALRTYAALLRDADKTMCQLGWERINLPYGTLMYDGRPVQWVGRKGFVLPPEVFKQRLAEAFEAARAQPETKRTQAQSKPGESLTSVLCPACRSVMAKSPICPNCSKGKAGFKILCQCTECGHEVYL